MIRLKDVSIRFRGDKVLNHIDLDVKKGEFVFLIGRSGSGKSTLFKIMNRQLDNYTGEVWIDNIAIREEPKHTTRRRLATVYQSFELLSQKTVYENIALAGEIRGQKPDDIRAAVLEVIDQVGLSGKENDYPGELSGGQQQRIAIARALLNRPQVLLADEPTGNLDEATANQIVRLIQDLNESEGMTVIFITHDQQLVQSVAARTLRLENGGLIEC